MPHDNTEAVREAFASAADVEDANAAAPRTPVNGSKNASPNTPASEEQTVEEICAGLPLNDTGNGKRFVAHFGDMIVHVSRVGWHIWNGRYWRKDEDSLEVRRLAQTMGEKIEAEIRYLVHSEGDQIKVDNWEWAKAQISDLESKNVSSWTDEERAHSKSVRGLIKEIEDIREKLRKRQGRHITHAKNAGNSSPINNMLGEAKVGVSKPVDEMDKEPLAINVLNGTLRFSVERVEGGSKFASFQLHDHLREDLMTKAMNVTYEEGAACPNFLKFLDEVLPDESLRGFLQRSLGLALTGLQEQHLWFLFGSGANGKSVLVDLMARVMGEYSATAKIESFTGQSRRGGSDATPDLIPLIGARMVRASEPEAGERLKEGTIKELTGGEPFLVRPLHGDFVEVHPNFKLFISGNHKPDIRGTDDGIWRRVLLVPFDVQISKERRNPKLVDELFKEAPGILNWLIEGLKEYLEIGLQIPSLVKSATDEYREESDPIGSFLLHCCDITGDEADQISASDLADAFQSWLRANGGDEWQSKTRVQRQLKSRAGKYRCPDTKKTFQSIKKSSMFYVGVRLKSEFQRTISESKAHEIEPDF